MELKVQTNNTNQHYFLSGGGEMGELIRSTDWSKTALGDPNDWPQSLRTMVGVMLDNPFGMYIAWGQDYIQLYNDGYRPILGATKHPKALGISTRETFEEIWHIIGSMFEGVMNGNAVGFPDFMLPLNRNGFVEECYFDFSYSPIRVENGEVGGILVTVIETTNKKKAEEALKKTKENLYNTILQAPVAMCIFRGPNHIVELANERMFEFWGKPGEAFLNKPIFEGLSEGKGQGFEELLDGVYTTGKSFSAQELPITMPRNGKIEVVYVNFNYEAYREADGSISGIMAVATDVTDHVRARQKLEESEERFRIMADASPNIVWALNPDGSQKYINKFAIDYLGITLEGILEVNWTPFIHPDDLESTQKEVSNAMMNKSSYSKEHRLLRHDGVYRWFLSQGAPSYFPNGDLYGYVGSGIDIQDFKESEQALIESGENFRDLADNIPNLAWMADPYGSIYWYNQRWYEYTGKTKEEMEGLGWQSVHHPEELPRVSLHLKKAIDSGEPFNMVFPIRRHDGKYCPFLTRVQPIRDEKGKIIKWFGTNTDITEQQAIQEQLQVKNAELIKINNDLDNFIYTASHDLKAPIGNIEGLVKVLSKSIDENIRNSPRIVSIFSMIQQSIERFKHTIIDLTEIAKIQAGQEEDSSLLTFKEMLEEVRLNIKNLIDESNASINENFSQAPTINFSKKNLRSILYNLVSNAVKYRSPERPVIVDIKTYLSIDNYLVLTVTDNGLGIKDEDKNKVFTMFKRLHTHVEGTGIGLSIVKKIMENNGGSIEIDSEVGMGTKFILKFCI